MDYHIRKINIHIFILHTVLTSFTKTLKSISSNFMNKKMHNDARYLDDLAKLLPTASTKGCNFSLLCPAGSTLSSIRRNERLVFASKVLTCTFISAVEESVTVRF